MLVSYIPSKAEDQKLTLGTRCWNGYHRDMAQVGRPQYQSYLLSTNGHTRREGEESTNLASWHGALTSPPKFGPV
jgi:hypothetical protein